MPFFFATIETFISLFSFTCLKEFLYGLFEYPLDIDFLYYDSLLKFEDLLYDLFLFDLRYFSCLVDGERIFSYPY